MASSPQQLEIEMIKLQVKDKVTYKFFSIVYDGSSYTAWYHGDATILFKEQLQDLFKPVKVKAPDNDYKKNNRRS